MCAQCCGLGDSLRSIRVLHVRNPSTSSLSSTHSIAPAPTPRKPLHVHSSRTGHTTYTPRQPGPNLTPQGPGPQKIKRQWPPAPQIGDGKGSLKRPPAVTTRKPAASVFLFGAEVKAPGPSAGAAPSQPATPSLGPTLASSRPPLHSHAPAGAAAARGGPAPASAALAPPASVPPSRAQSRAPSVAPSREPSLLTLPKADDS